MVYVDGNCTSYMHGTMQLAQYNGCENKAIPVHVCGVEWLTCIAIFLH